MKMFRSMLRHHLLIAALGIATLCDATILSTAQSRSNTEPPGRFDVVEATIDDVQAALRSEQVTCRGLVELYLARIRSYDKSGPALNAVQTVNPRAQQEADRLDAVF